MFGWKDIIYSNGAIRKEGVQARVVWLGQLVQPPIGMMWQPGAIILNLAISQGHFFSGEGAHEIAGDIYSLKVSEVAARLLPSPQLDL